MGVYGTQTTLTTPTLDDRVVLSDAGITKSSTLQQVLDVLVPAIDSADVPFTPAAGIAATDVQAAIEEVAGDLTAHLGDTSDAHAASAVSVLDTADNFVGTDVEAVLEELFDAIDTSVTGVSSVNGETGAVTLTANDVDITDSGNFFTGTDVEAALQEVAGGTSLLNPYLKLVAGGSSVENIGAVESNVNTVATTGATETLDLSTYGVHDLTMDQSCAFTLSNPAPSGKLTVAILIIRGAFTPSFTNTMIEPDNTALTYSTPVTWIVWTVDGGTSYFLASAGKAFA